MRRSESQIGCVVPPPRGRAAGVAPLARACRAGNAPDSLGSNQFELGELAAQRVDQRGPLPDKQFACPVKHPTNCCAPLLISTNRVVRPVTASQISLRVDHIMLAALDVRFTISPASAASCPSAVSSRMMSGAAGTMPTTIRTVTLSHQP